MNFLRRIALSALTLTSIWGAWETGLLAPRTLSAAEHCTNATCSSPTSCKYSPSNSCEFLDARSCLSQRCAFIMY
ncbi:MAG TPA: hypothetical protein VHG08_04855 [Longimicrobium sp.]|nr:hypothetical protein [Longimicrobium sp.]